MEINTNQQIERLNKVYDSMHRLNIRNVLFSSASDQDLLKLIELDEKRKETRRKSLLSHK